MLGEKSQEFWPLAPVPNKGVNCVDQLNYGANGIASRIMLFEEAREDSRRRENKEKDKYQV